MSLAARLVPLLVLTFCAESQAQVGVASRDAVGAVVPTDTTRWRPVAAPAGRRVFVDAEALRRGGGVVEVWTWHAYASAHRPVFGVPYDRVLARDQVYCRVRATAPLQVVRYLGAASAGAFMFPPDVGPFGWAPGSVEEAVGTWACQEAGGAAGAR